MLRTWSRRRRLRRRVHLFGRGGWPLRSGRSWSARMGGGAARPGAEDGAGLGFVGELAAGGVDVFAAAVAEAGVDAVFFEMLHELVDCGLIGLLEESLVDGVVFDDIDKVGGHL